MYFPSIDILNKKGSFVGSGSFSLACTMKRIAVLTSGGDAPGMNAAVRAIVRTGLEKGFEIFGVRDGFEGLLKSYLVPLKARDVGGIIQQAGTFLGTSRCEAFKTQNGIRKAKKILQDQKMAGLFIIGGNGSQTGAHHLSQTGFPVVGIASTIDNDLLGTEVTIGSDTALNIALEAIDRLKVTASSHRRAILVETMGRDCGYLALMAGLAGGAEVITIPEVKTDPKIVKKRIIEAYKRGKKHALIVAAEGADYNALRLAEYFKDDKDIGFGLRVTILGHVQRGGIPSAFDRILATRLGVFAVDEFDKGNHGCLVGLQNGSLKASPLKEIAGKTNKPNLKLLEVARILAK